MSEKMEPCFVCNDPSPVEDRGIYVHHSNCGTTLPRSKWNEVARIIREYREHVMVVTELGNREQEAKCDVC